MFVDEEQVYRLARLAGLEPPRHAWVEDAAATFEPDARVVVKGLGEGLWHKSEVGAVAFAEAAQAVSVASGMRARVEAAGHRWIGALVCEHVDLATVDGLTTEAIVSVGEREGIWTVMLGLGGVRAEALGELAPPLLWPVAWVPVETALNELCAHLLGRTWLGRLRGTRPLTTLAHLDAMLRALWSLADRAAADGLRLIEMNPVALDRQGVPRPLDGVGLRARAPSDVLPRPPSFLPALVTPRRVAVAGVSARVDSPGHVIAQNLARATAIETLIVKPEADTFMGFACVPDVAGLVLDPVDLLVVALPAAAAVAMVEALIAQGGGATVVGLVAGGIGDGADHEGLALRLSTALAAARNGGAWTPAVLGPNLLGHVVPALGLDTTFIPSDRWHPESRPGSLAVLSQSGAFLLSRLASCPDLGLGLGLALGNQLDVDVADVMDAIADMHGVHESDDEHAAHASPGARELRAIAAYVEGFAPDQLRRLALAARRLVAAGKRVMLYRAGTTTEGQAAAASHTGAMAGDLALERAVLMRAGVSLAPTLGAFEAGMRWLSAYPTLRPGPVAVISNAGFESVCGADRFPSARLDPDAEARLATLLATHGLAQLVTPRLPLDLTPMASLDAYRDAVSLLAGGDASVIVIGLVPFTKRLAVTAADPEPEPLAEFLMATAAASNKAVGVVVDGGPAWESLRRTLSRAGLPVFATMEDAALGLAALAPPAPLTEPHP